MSVTVREPLPGCYVTIIRDNPRIVKLSFIFRSRFCMKNLLIYEHFMNIFL